MYCCVFWCEFIDLVGFFWLLLGDPCYSLHNTKYLAITFTPKSNFRRICMESSEHKRETICPTRLVFGKKASWVFFFQNILTNPIISQILFLMTSHFRTLFRILILPTSDYSQTPPYGHPLKTDTGSLLRTAQFALTLEKENPYISLNSSRLYRHNVNTDTFFGPLNIRINGYLE